MSPTGVTEDVSVLNELTDILRSTHVQKVNIRLVLLYETRVISLFGNVPS